MLAILQTDRSIIRNVLRGRTNRFGVLVDRYGRLVYAIAYAYLRNPQDAEDVVQESYTRLYQRLDTLSWKQSIGPWLAQVARNVAVDRLRKREREVLVAEQPPASITHFPNPAREEMRQLVAEQLEHLDTADREVLLLHYFLGKKAREIASLLDIQPDTAKKRLQRARDELGRRLVDVLKEDLLQDRAEPARRRQIMAAIAASPVAWKPSASLALSGAAIVGSSAVKAVTGIAVSAILIAALVWGGWRYMSRPFPTKEFTTASSFEFEPIAPRASADPEPGALGASGDEKKIPASEPSTEERPTKPTVSTGLRVYGLLMTEDRQPVVGATVTIDNDPIVEQRRLMRMAGSDTPEVKEVTFAAVSDRQGRFDFESVPYVSKQNLNAFRLWSRQGDLGVCERLDLSPASTERYCELVMMQEGVLTGLVTDVQGVPIDRAYVFLRGVHGKKELERLPEYRADTGKDGRFTFEFLPPGSYRLEIGARGFSSLETPWVTAGDPNLVFQLDTGDTISGRVVEDATGKALPHVGVFARQRAEYNYRVALAETNDSGQFTIAGLVPATFLLSIGRTLTSDDVPYALLEPVCVAVQAGQPVTGVELRAVLGATVSGRVVEADTGQPPQGLTWVRALGSGAVPWERGSNVEKDGGYTIYGFPPGEFVLAPSHAEISYAETKKTVSIRGNTPVTGVDFSLVKLDKNSAKDQLLTGKVVDQAGAAVEGANVMAAPADNQWQGSSALTDAEGEFAISFNRDDRMPNKVYVQAFMQGAMSRRAGPLAPLGNSCTLQLEPAGRIEGVVVDESGEPVSGAVVAAIGDEDAGSILWYGAPWPAMMKIQGTKAGTSDTGAFFMPSVMAGSYRIEVYVPSATMDAPVAKGHAQVRAGDTLRTRLVIDTQGLGTIEGTVTVNGAPAPDTHVTGTWVDASWLNTVQDYSDPSGHYVLAHVQPGKARVTVEVMPSGQTSAGLVQHTQFVEVEAGQTATADFNLNAEKTGAVEGYVYVNGAPTGYINVEFKPADAEEEIGGNTNARTNGEGWFRVEGLAEGPYIAEAQQYVSYGMGRFRLSDAQELNVKAGETGRVDFHLNAGRIEGTVSGIRKGQYAIVSLLDGSVNLFSLTPQVLQSVGDRVLTVRPVPQDGPFTFEGIPGGNYVLGAVSVPEDASQWDDAAAIAAIIAGKYTAEVVQVIAGETATMDLALP